MAKKKVITDNSISKNLAALHFLYNVVDPDGTANKEEVLKTLCDKFAVPYVEEDQLYSNLNLVITNYIHSNDWYQEINYVWWQTEIEGEVSIEYSASEYKYITSSNEEHIYRFYEYGKLIVNGKELEDCPWDEAKMKKYVEEMSILFSKDNTDIDNKFDAVFKRAWTRFEKGSESETKKEMENACLLIYGEIDDYFSEQYYYAIDTYSKFISQKWYVYLWECLENNTPEEYILSLKSFIRRNKEEWAKRKENKEVNNKIYTEEHEHMRNNFVLEPNAVIFALWDMIQK